MEKKPLEQFDDTSLTIHFRSVNLSKEIRFYYQQ